MIFVTDNPLGYLVLRPPFTDRETGAPRGRVIHTARKQ